MLSNRVAVVTGAGRGIGRAVARMLAEHGAKVMVNDLDPTAAEETAALCRESGGEHSAAVSIGSVADAVYTRSLMDAAGAAFGSVDILVNNAGMARDAVVHRMDLDQWKEVLEVNLTGTFNCVQAAAPWIREASKKELKERGDVQYHRKIINFSSTAAVRGNPGQINYAAAKFGVIGLTRTLAREWAPFRVNVNCVIPGFTDTHMTRPADGQGGIPQAQRDAFIAQLPFGRAARPEDVAKVVLFLSSDLSDWVTGQEINASGGHQIP